MRTGAQHAGIRLRVRAPPRLARFLQNTRRMELPFDSPVARRFRPVVLAVFSLAVPWAVGAAQENESCMECHDGASARAEVSQGAPAFDWDRHDASVHGGLDCIACHVELDGMTEAPHPTGLPPVDCTECHEGRAETMREKGHLAGGVACQDCHGGHPMVSYHDADLALATGRVNALCVGCHTDVLMASGDDPHARIFGRRSCSACHDPHQGGRGETLPADRVCMTCHAGDEAGDASEVAPPSTLAGSVHGAAGISCVLCHGDVQHVDELPHEEELAPVRCETCHPAAAAAHAVGVHAHPVNGEDAASCTHCHGAHQVYAVDDPRSLVSPRRQPATCEACHRPEPPLEHPAPAGAEVLRYETSIHGRLLLEQGLVVTATCSSCHGSHEIRPAEDPEAATSRGRVPYTCGACHAGILEGYMAGVHGAGFLTAGVDVPVCTDCHSEHAIEDPALAVSSVSVELVAQTCARCHADEALASLYGFDAGRLGSWGSSYHGVATALGERSAANCASCHGHHEILAATDPRSRVHPDNLEETCGGCHEGASATFVQVPVHSVIDREHSPVAWYARTIYAWLIVGVIGGFLLFILIDVFGQLRLRMGWGPPEGEPFEREAWPDEAELIGAGESFERMSRQGRWQHGILVLSFLLLVLTGLPLFLHDVPLMRSLVDLEGGFRLRSRLHRAGAVGLIGLSLWHFGMLAFSGSARRWLASILLRPRDVVDFLRQASFHLGLTKDRPLIGRYGLVEKLEYAAVWWGNLVMILSGLILWRPGWFLGWTPGWTFDVCRVVHGYEATLAFLAIVVWHLYHVHLRPGVFPMSKVWLTGRISARELRRHHPIQYAAILERRRAAREGTPPD